MQSKQHHCDYFKWVDDVSLSNENVSLPIQRQEHVVNTENLMRKIEQLQFTVGVMQKDIELLKYMREMEGKKLEQVEINVTELMKTSIEHSETPHTMLRMDNDRIEDVTEKLIEKIRKENNLQGKKIKVLTIICCITMYLAFHAGK